MWINSGYKLVFDHCHNDQNDFQSDQYSDTLHSMRTIN